MSFTVLTVGQDARAKVGVGVVCCHGTANGRECICLGLDKLLNTENEAVIKPYLTGQAEDVG